MINKNELPKNWKWVKTSEAIKIINNGYTPKSQFLSNGFGEIPFIKVYNLNFDGSLNFKKNPTFIPSATHQSDLKRSICYPGDVLINIVGPPLGKVSIVTNQYPEWNINQASVLFRPNEQILSKYISYFLQNPVTINWLEGTSKATAGQWNVKVSTCREIPLPLPPLAEQERIVARIEELFSELDVGIASLKTAQAQLKTYRHAVLKYAFEGKLTNENVNEGELPKGWKWVKIVDVAESLDNLRIPINKTERLKRVGDVPYYGANGRTGWIDDFLFDEPLILVVEDETFTGRELPFSYKITGKSWVNNHAHILRSKFDLNLDYLNYQLAYYPFLPLTTGTTGRKKLTKLALMNAPIKICSLAEQQRIVEEIESRLSVCDKLEETISASLKQSEALRQSILKQAFEGKLVQQTLVC